VTVAARRQGVQCLVAHGLAPRRACIRLQLQRSTLNYPARPDRNAELGKEGHELAQRHPRYGYRRVWALRRRRRRRVNKKHGHRLWQRAKLQVRQAMRTQGAARAASVPVQALHPGHVWPDDCLHDHGRNGTPLKVLTVMDELTREGLAIEVAMSLPAQRVRTVLEGLVVSHGRPQCIRSDNGPECIALALRGWLAPHPMQTLDIDPGCPWPNGFGESCNGTVRDECWHRHVFHAGAEARMVLAGYRRRSNAERPHSSLGYRTPTEVTRDWSERQTPSGGL
jgi:putative transposase